MKQEKTPIQKLYDKIPSFSCKEGCIECCDNQIQFAPEEGQRCGGFPFTSRWCPYITEKGCSVYQDRPFLCRLYASSVLLPCPYGCKPEHPLSEEETRELLQQYLKLKQEQETSNASK